MRGGQSIRITAGKGFSRRRQPSLNISPSSVRWRLPGNDGLGNRVDAAVGRVEAGLGGLLDLRFLDFRDGCLGISQGADDLEAGSVTGDALAGNEAVCGMDVLAFPWSDSRGGFVKTAHRNG